MRHPGALMASIVTELEGQVVAGKYRLDKLIGRGGFSAVYRGEHLAMQRTVAIKLLDVRARGAGEDASTTHRFSREAKVISQLESGSTITVYDYGVEGELCYLIMEFVDGHSLKELLAQLPVIDAHRAVRIAIQILESLDEAHHYNILHRDLKPANVMLTRDFRGHERVKVVDFGIAKVLEDLRGVGAQGGDLTQEGAFIGTPRYAAPEQLFAQQLSPSTDVYGVGVVMWDMLVGEQLIKGASWYDCSRFHLDNQDNPIRLPEHIDPALSEIIERALARPWADRWQSADEMKRALVAWLGQHGVDVADVGGSFSAPPPSSEQIELAEPGFLDDSLDEDSLVFVRGKSVMDPNVDELESWGVGGDDLFGDLGGDLGGDFGGDVGFERPSQATRPEPHRALVRDSFFDDPSPSQRSGSWEDDDDFDAPGERKSWRQTSDEPIADVAPSAPSVTESPNRAEPRVGRTAAERAQRAAAVGGARSASAKKRVLTVVTAVFSIGMIAIFFGVFGPMIAAKVSSAQPAPADPVGTASDEPAPEAPVDEPASDESAQASKYSSEGIWLAIQGAKWKGSSEPIVTDLGSILQESLLFERGPERCEVTIIQAKSREQLEDFNKAADPRARTLWFDAKLVKITPLGESSLLCASDIAQVLRRYKAIVDARE